MASQQTIESKSESADAAEGSALSVPTSAHDRRPAMRWFIAVREQQRLPEKWPLLIRTKGRVKTGQRDTALNEWL